MRTRLRWIRTHGSRDCPTCGRRSPRSRRSWPAVGEPIRRLGRCRRPWRPSRPRTTLPWPRISSSAGGRSASSTARAARGRPGAVPPTSVPRRRPTGQSAVVAAGKARLDTAVSAAAAAEARSAAQAAADLSTDQASLADLTAQQERLQGAFDATNSDDDGILIRLEALSRLGEENTTLAIAHYMLALLFICIELLPVLMKVLLNFGPPTAYDRLTALRDRGDVAIEELQQSARWEVEEAQVELLVFAEKQRLARQREALLVRERAALARAAARAEAEAAAEESSGAPVPSSRRMWDTGPILGLARNAAVRTVRSVTRRSSDRVAV